MTTDPMDLLRESPTPVEPRPAFVEELRQRLARELDPDPDPDPISRGEGVV